MNLWTILQAEDSSGRSWLNSRTKDVHSRCDETDPLKIGIGGVHDQALLSKLAQITAVGGKNLCTFEAPDVAPVLGVEIATIDPPEILTTPSTDIGHRFTFAFACWT